MRPVRHKSRKREIRLYTREASLKRVQLAARAGLRLRQAVLQLRQATIKTVNSIRGFNELLCDNQDKSLLNEEEILALQDDLRESYKAFAVYTQENHEQEDRKHNRSSAG